MQKHLNIKITGDVQGVGFRYYIKKRADELEIFGFARNEPNGSVFIEAEGETDFLNKFLEYCRSGPGNAQVSNIDVKESEMKFYNDFKIEIY